MAQPHQKVADSNPPACETAIALLIIGQVVVSVFLITARFSVGQVAFLMTDHLAKLIRQWMLRYEQKGRDLSRSRALHRYLLAREARERDDAAATPFPAHKASQGE